MYCEKHCARNLQLAVRSHLPKGLTRKRIVRDERRDQNTTLQPQHATARKSQSGETETKLPTYSHACRSGKVSNDYLDTRDKHLNIGAHCRDCGWVFLENVSEEITVISTSEFSIVFESFDTALYLLTVCDIGWILPQAHRLKTVRGNSRKKFFSVEHGFVDFQDNIELEGIVIRGGNLKYHLR